MRTLTVTTVPGEETVRMQLGDFPPRRMTREDAQRLIAKAMDEGVTIEHRTALGTIVIG